MKPTLDTPLSHEELDALDGFLAESGLDAPMDISMLDGYLCAVFSGPRAILPSEWLPWVWDFDSGQEQPQFRDDKAANEVVGWIMRLANEISSALTTGADAFEPMFPVGETDDGEVPLIDDWCFGYLRGIELDADAWQPLMESQPGWFETMLLYGTEDGWKELEELVEKHPDGAVRHAAYVERIAPALAAIHAHWVGVHGVRSPVLMGATTTVRGAAKPGRNDPCPCGSGRKYKLCHGAAA